MKTEIPKEKEGTVDLREATPSSSLSASSSPLDFYASSSTGPHIVYGTGGDLGDIIGGGGSTSGSTVGSSSSSWITVDSDAISHMYYAGKNKKQIDKINKQIFKMKRVKDVLEKVYSNECLRKSVVPLFIGNPGLGKTVLIQEFAEEKGVKLVELITSQMSPFEISGIAMK